MSGSFVKTNEEKQLILPHVQSLSSQASVSSQTTLSTNVTEKFRIPVAVVEAILEANRTKAPDQATTPVSVGPKQMNVLVSKPQTSVAKGIPTVTKIAPCITNTLVQNKKGTPKVSLKPVQNHYLHRRLKDVQ